MTPLQNETLFFNFWFRPPTPKIYSPKFGIKSPISRLVWQIDRRRLGLPGGRPGGGDLCCHGNDIWLGAEIYSRLPACVYVCHAPSNCFFSFVSRWNRAIFARQFSMWHSTKLFSSIFDLGPLTPKICTKSPITRLVWQIGRRCLGLPRGFRGWPIQWNHTKCCGADRCCHGNEIWARRGDPFAYRLVLFFFCIYHSWWIKIFISLYIRCRLETPVSCDVQFTNADAAACKAPTRLRAPCT